ncbi:farnesol dehydrogenase-like [Teleopsis dalmanni]|uniref:farnesol dehydrogenase-like n=1 Tax=Teleopsis dalmanni TaxID=139649 RepID=UPI0018CF45F1|nr:farnesol dehydrogenase-like [Teleopsis dalmanni]
MERWNNKVAVVTGASSGIGAACCKTLVTKGMIVVGLARRFELMESELRAKLPLELRDRFYPVKCDVRQEEDIIRSFAWVEQTLGGVDVLVNNAGIARQTQIVAPQNTADLRAVVETNIMGVALCTREAFRSMKNRRVDGHVVVINSLAGHSVVQVPGFSYNIYPPTKHAITAMTEVLRQEFLLHETKIKITSISPGATDTDIYGDKGNIATDIPLLDPDNVADAIAYCIQTPPHVQIHELTIKPVGEKF